MAELISAERVAELLGNVSIHAARQALYRAGFREQRGYDPAEVAVVVTNRGLQWEEDVKNLCGVCRKPVNKTQPHITMNMHAETVKFNVTTVLRAQTMAIYHESCTRDTRYSLVRTGVFRAQ